MAIDQTPSQQNPVTRAERAAAYADLYEIPLSDLYCRYGVVLLKPEAEVPVKEQVTCE